MLLLTGIGPLLAWRKTSISNLKFQFLWPVTPRLVTAALVFALGVRVWASDIAFVFSGFVLGTICQEFWRGAVIRRKSTGTDLFTATIGLVGRSRRRYGGYIVHVGIVLMCLGFAGQGFKQSNQVLLKPGQQTTLGSYTVRMDALKVTNDNQKQMITGHFTVLEGGREIAKMYPGALVLQQARRADDRGGHPPEVPGRPVPQHAQLPGRGPDGESRDRHQPARELDLARLCGDGARHRHRPAARTHVRVRDGEVPGARGGDDRGHVPADDVARRAGACAAHRELAAPCLSQCTRPFERELQRDIICMCGTCGRKNLAECTCSKAADMRTELVGPRQDRARHAKKSFSITSRNTAARSRSRRPSIKGFNRLAWFFPYAVGGFAAVAGAFMVRKWSRRSHDEPPVAAPQAPPSAEEAALQARLDRELENLD